jgi:hypothetical protein
MKMSMECWGRESAGGGRVLVERHFLGKPEILRDKLVPVSFIHH